MGIKKKVNELRRKYGTNDPFVLCERLGIWVYNVPLGKIEGHYTYKKEKRYFL